MWKLEVFSTKIILWQTTNVRRDSGGLQPESHDVKSIGRWAPLVVKILNQNKQQAACKSTTIRFHIFCDSQHLFITWKHGIELKFMESWESCFKDFESKTTTTWFVYRQIHGSMKCVFPHYHWILQGPSENIRVSTKHRSSPNIHRWIWGEHEMFQRVTRVDYQCLEDSVRNLLGYTLSLIRSRWIMISMQFTHPINHCWKDFQYPPLLKVKH